MKVKVWKITVKCVILFVLVFVCFNLIGFLYAFITPKLDIRSANAFSVYDNKSKLVFQGNGNDSWVSLRDMNKNIVNATISTEDKNFYRHFGFDYPRIAKALMVNIYSGDIEQGASSITQQYAKNLFWILRSLGAGNGKRCGLLMNLRHIIVRLRFLKGI